MTNPLIKDWQIDPAALGGGTGLWNDTGTALTPISPTHGLVLGGSLTVNGLVMSTFAGPVLPAAVHLRTTPFSIYFGPGDEASLYYDTSGGGNWLTSPNTIQSLGNIQSGPAGALQAGNGTINLGTPPDYVWMTKAAGTNNVTLNIPSGTLTLGGGSLIAANNARASTINSDTWLDVGTDLVVHGQNSKFDSNCWFVGNVDVGQIRFNANLAGNVIRSNGPDIFLDVGPAATGTSVRITNFLRVHGGNIFWDEAGSVSIGYEATSQRLLASHIIRSSMGIGAYNCNISVSGYAFETLNVANANGQGLANMWVDQSAQAGKSNVRALEHDPLAIVLDPNLNAVSYDVLATTPGQGSDEKPGGEAAADLYATQVGFIADDWFAVLPEVVSVLDGEVRGMSYGRVTAIVFQALKDYVTRTDATIADLTARLAALEGTP
jgi:hypothetical protein